MKLTAYPYYVPESEYDRQLGMMLHRLKVLEGVLAIYQVGGVSSAGISDLDMFVVFEDGVRTEFNPLSGLSHEERYLFNHSPYAATRSQMDGAQHYTFLHNFRLLWGKEDWPDAPPLPEEDRQAMKEQTALEYLLKMYINTVVERTFGVIKVRGLLLHVKALFYDMEFLNVSSGKLYEAIEKIIEWRSCWFLNAPGRMEFLAWHNSFFLLLEEFLQETLCERKIYLPDNARHVISRGLQLEPCEHFGYTHSGFTLPSLIGGLSSKLFNIQYRFNRFIFHLPVTRTASCNAVADRYSYLAETATYHRKMLPYYLVPGSSIAIF